MSSDASDCVLPSTFTIDTCEQFAADYDDDVSVTSYSDDSDSSSSQPLPLGPYGLYAIQEATPITNDDPANAVTDLPSGPSSELLTSDAMRSLPVIVTALVDPTSVVPVNAPAPVKKRVKRKVKIVPKQVGDTSC